MRWRTFLSALSIATLCCACDSIPNEQAFRSYSDAESRFARVGDMRIHYKDEGHGPPVVLVHGILSSLQTWDGWTARLRADHRLVRLDLPGAGLSDAPPGGQFSIDMYVRTIAQLLDQLGIRRFSIAGSSLGGWVAWELAAAHPERVEKLILIDSAGYVSEGTPAPLPVRLARMPLVRTGLPFFTPAFAVERFVRSTYGNPSSVDPVTLKRYLELFLRQGNREAFVSLANSATPDDTRLLGSIQAPTLILWGAKDRWIDVKFADRFKHELPHARLKIYDELGHIGMEENPELTARDAAEFLDSREPAERAR